MKHLRKFIELTKNEGFIYWDNAKYKKTNTGDKVFVTNVSKGTWYLTELIDNDIPITRDDDQDCITFNDAGYLYTVPDAHRWGNFVKLKILEKTENNLLLTRIPVRDVPHLWKMMEEMEK